MTLTKKNRLNLINQVLSKKQDLKNKYMNEDIQKQNKDIQQIEYLKPITTAIKEQPVPQPTQPVTHNYLVPALNYDEAESQSHGDQNVEFNQVQDGEKCERDSVK